MFGLQLAEAPEPVSETTAITTEKPDTTPAAREHKTERRKGPARRKAVQACFSKAGNVIPMTLRYMKPDRSTCQIIVGATRLAFNLTTGAKKRIGPTDILDFPVPPNLIPLAN